MSHVSIQSMTKHFDGKPPTTPVDDLDLEIEEGEFLVLLGPSGCGKTTTLRCLAGLETPSAGPDQLRADHGVRRRAPGQPVAGQAQHRHGVPVVRAVAAHDGAQEHRLPAAGRQIKEGMPGAGSRRRRPSSTAEQLLDRYPAQLSGGQQQRVALARGLVARPDLVLFDEPLSNLDARLRDQVRAEIHELHGRLGFTAVFVTHDQSEALALGDRLAIMRNGRIEQYDTPSTSSSIRPPSTSPPFIGMCNRLQLERQDGGWAFGEFIGDRLQARSLRSSRPCRPAAARRHRPRTRDQACEGETIGSPADVVDSQFGGAIDVVVTAGGHRLEVQVPSGHLRGGRGSCRSSPVSAGFATTTVISFDGAGSRIAGHVPVEAPEAVGADDHGVPRPRRP